APDAVRIVRFIKRAKALGFTLDEVESLLDLAAGGPESCDMARELTLRRRAELDRRIADLLAVRASLDRLVATCAMPRGERECPCCEPSKEMQMGGEIATRPMDDFKRAYRARIEQ